MSNVSIERPNVTVDVREDVQIEIVRSALVPVSDDVVKVAGENLSALRVVTLDASGNAVYASNASESTAVVYGLTITSALSGAGVGIRTYGIVEDASWSWTRGPVFLGTNGTLTQTAPTNGAVIVHVGRAFNATTIIVDADTTITTV